MDGFVTSTAIAQFQGQGLLSKHPHKFTSHQRCFILLKLESRTLFGAPQIAAMFIILLQSAVFVRSSCRYEFIRSVCFIVRLGAMLKEYETVLRLV